MDLSTENIIDLVLAAFFLCMIARGWYMGLVFQAARLVALAAAGIFSYVMANVAGIPLLSGLFFFITFVLFLQVVKIVKIVDWIPVVGTLDRREVRWQVFSLHFWHVFSCSASCIWQCRRRYGTAGG